MSSLACLSAWTCIVSKINIIIDFYNSEQSPVIKLIEMFSCIMSSLLMCFFLTHYVNLLIIIITCHTFIQTK